MKEIAEDACRGWADAGQTDAGEADRGSGEPGAWDFICSTRSHNKSVTSVKIQGWEDGSQPQFRPKDPVNRLSRGSSWPGWHWQQDDGRDRERLGKHFLAMMTKLNTVVLLPFSSMIRRIELTKNRVRISNASSEIGSVAKNPPTCLLVCGFRIGSWGTRPPSDPGPKQRGLSGRPCVFALSGSAEIKGGMKRPRSVTS